ncbi:MAG: leucyl aminopeptidase [Aquiluna sp.]|nr:leucyl aminopeptidase [Aquiluna sp.]MCF8545138.1 leucyl aminopeptidase [Aquiluna sp.]
MQELATFGAKSKIGSVARLPYKNGALVLIGAGSSLSPRDFAAAAARAAISDVPMVVSLPGATEADVTGLAEGLNLGPATNTDYKAQKDNLVFHILVEEELKDLNIDSNIAITDIIRDIREIINLPANDLYPESLAAKARVLCSALPIDIDIWDEAKLEQERCGGILSVGRGSVRPPRLVKLSYRGGGKHLALVGKGITFDTGGLSLKPAESMVGMKYDMAGAATILGAIAAIARLGLKVDVTAYLCIAENMPSGQATRPGDVIRIRNGKSVEVLNTDAEGRLVLADGLSLAQETNPDHIIDVATLTGAATIALGNRYAGVMGHGLAVEMVKAAAQSSEELVWEMPLPEELRPLLDSDLADIANVKIGNRAGGMLVGGHFLAEFVSPETSWAHLDIAGPANNDGAPYSVVPKGASGVMIRTLVETARTLAL